MVSKAIPGTEVRVAALKASAEVARHYEQLDVPKVCGVGHQARSCCGMFSLEGHDGGL